MFLMCIPERYLGITTVRAGSWEDISWEMHWGLEGIHVRCNKPKTESGGDRPLCEEKRFRAPSGYGLISGIITG